MTINPDAGNGTNQTPAAGADETPRAIVRLSRDLVKAGETLADKEARFLVDNYYAIQKTRIRAGNQMGALSKTKEPHELVGWLNEQSKILETQISNALRRYVGAQPLGESVMSVLGIGHILAAGLLAHIEIERAPHVGHIYRFAGLTPAIEWKKGQKRPYNATLKTLCWKIGDSFVKQSGRESSWYGAAYKRRKAEEWRRNLAGEYSERAAAALVAKQYGDDTAARKWYSGAFCDMTESETGPKGIPATDQEPGIAMLSPGHIDMRARRWTVKLYLSHLHQVMYEQHHQKAAPPPYPFSHLGHANRVTPAEAGWEL